MTHPELAALDAAACPCCRAPCTVTYTASKRVAYKDENGDYQTQSMLGLRFYKALYTADQMAALIEERDRLRAENEKLRKRCAPEWFYLGNDCSSEQCRFSIHEVLDEDYFWSMRTKGDHVVEIATATSCPTIWAVVHCYTEAEKDELQTDDDYSVVEYETEAEARAALAGEKP